MRREAFRQLALRHHSPTASPSPRRTPCPACRAKRTPIAAVCAARDEGDEVRLTCESFLGNGVDEIVIVDDGSTDDSCDLDMGDVTIVRHETPVGPAKSRNEGARLAIANGARAIIFADAHERVVEGALRRFGGAAIKHDAIVCAAVQPLNPTRETWTRYGGRLAYNRHKRCYKMAYNEKRPTQQLTPIGGLIGACYAMSAETFDRIGGWIPTVSWGYNEQALTMKAFFCGVPMLVDRSLIMGHRFKRKFNYAVSKHETRLNRFMVHRIVFDASTFWDHWWPLLSKAFRRDARKARELVESDEVRALAADFQTRKVRTDAEFFATAIGADGWSADRRKDGSVKTIGHK